MQKWFYNLVCEGTNYYVDSVLLGTCYIIGARHMNFLVFLNTYYTLYYLAHELS